jgi:Leucine-rich repeat (LRR) protein
VFDLVACAGSTQVVLVDQQLDEFPMELFSGMLTLPLAQIRLLDLRFNSVPDLPPRIGQMSHLTCLRLTGNCLSTLPLELSQISCLQELQLSDNSLERVPEVVSQLPALHTLGLAGNSLTSLPDSLGHLRSLTSLDVARNQLVTLPAQALGALTSLVTLDVSDNCLTALPASIGLCFKLREVRPFSFASSAATILPPRVYHLDSTHEPALCLVSPAQFLLPFGNKNSPFGGSKMSRPRTSVEELTRRQWAWGSYYLLYPSNN